MTIAGMFVTLCLLSQFLSPSEERAIFGDEWNFSPRDSFNSFAETAGDPPGEISTLLIMNKNYTVKS